MPIRLSQAIPWGRSFDEYRRMFDLSENDLTGRLLGCGDGPASFNAKATARGLRVISCDPIYVFNAVQIQRRIDESWRSWLAWPRCGAIRAALSGMNFAILIMSAALAWRRCGVSWRTLKMGSEADVIFLPHSPLRFLLPMTPSISPWFRTCFFSTRIGLIWIFIGAINS